MKIESQLQTSGLQKSQLGVFITFLQRMWLHLSTVVNGKIGFGDGTTADNIDGVWVTATTVIGNFTVTHNLGRIPAGWFMVKTDAFENLKFISSTTTQIVLAGQNGGAHITLFIF